MIRLDICFTISRASLPDLLARADTVPAAIYTHFATADDPESPLFNEQRLRFEQALGTLPASAVPVSSDTLTPGGSTRPERTPYLHAANSAAMLRDSRVWYDRVRPGLLLYGIVPPPLASTL